jgi:anti-sigma B factor antagonist
MQYSLDHLDHYSVLRLKEDNLNSLVAPHLKAQLILLHTEGAPAMILDLSEVNFVDSSGLSSILTGNRLWKDDTNDKFIVIGINSPNIKRLIEISQLHSILAIEKDLDDALKHLVK